MSVALSVVSESPEPNTAAGRLKDCGYASAIMALLYGGFSAFPNDPHSTTEREALERSDDRADETGAYLSDLDVAVKRRYGVILGSPMGGAVSSVLSTTGQGVILQGNTSALPAAVRRSPAADHAVFVVPIGGGKVRLLDPLAPSGSAGDIVNVDDCVRFFAALPGGGGRVIKAGAYAATAGGGSVQTLSLSFGGFFRAATISCALNAANVMEGPCVGHRPGETVRLYGDASPLTAAMVDVWAQNAYEQAGRQDMGSLGAWLGLGNQMLPPDAAATFKTACRSAAAPYLGQPVSALPGKLDVSNVPAYVDTSIPAQAGDELAGFAAELGNQLAHFALLLAIIAGLYLGARLLFREQGEAV